MGESGEEEKFFDDDVGAEDRGVEKATVAVVVEEEGKEKKPPDEKGTFFVRYVKKIVAAGVNKVPRSPKSEILLPGNVLLIRIRHEKKKDNVIIRFFLFHKYIYIYILFFFIWAIF